MKRMSSLSKIAISASIIFSSTLITASVYAANPSAPIVASITTGSYVEVDYIGTLSDGTVFDTSIASAAKKANTYTTQRNYKPLHTVVGQHQIIAGFERALLGMKKGEKKTFTLEPHDAYGEIDRSKRAIINRSYFDESQVTPLVGNTYGLQGIAMKLIELSGDLATLDRNHPLAGKSLTFSIQIKEIARLAAVPANAQSFPQGVMSTQQLRKMQQSTMHAKKDGKKPAFTVIEYSDLECPYCVRQYKDGIIANLLQKFPGNIAYVYKPVVGNNHPNSAYKASAAICAGLVSGSTAFRDIYQGILSGSTPNKVMDAQTVFSLVKQSGIDMTKWQTCMYPEANTPREDGGKPASATAKKIYEKNGNEFNTWGDNLGTPSTLIVNNKNRQRILVEGAYGLDTFAGILQMWTK